MQKVSCWQARLGLQRSSEKIWVALEEKKLHKRTKRTLLLYFPEFDDSQVGLK
jgi:hypothetical protein